MSSLKSGVVILLVVLAACGSPSDDDAGTMDAGPALLCLDTCADAMNGRCDDGDAGATSSTCELGTDCTDCGPRQHCVPECTGRSCGPDSCGGECGPGCLSEVLCSEEGTCGCESECGDQECGLDPLCMTSCGTCAASETCNMGMCCAPFCSARMCGSDGCGGTCGNCTGGTACTSEGRCVLGRRPHDGPTAQLRLLFSEDRGVGPRRLCVFGADSDPLPYAVVSDLGLEGAATRAATYAVVPAGVTLRVTEHRVVGPDPESPSGCAELSTARPIGAGELGTEPLSTDAYYTLVAHTYDTFATGSCVDDATSSCEFYSSTDAELPFVPCSTEGLYLFEDGSRVDGAYVAGVRIVNLTANASRISSSSDVDQESVHGNPAGGTPIGISYRPPFPASRIRFCPDYVVCDATFPETARLEALRACRGGVAEWLIAELTDERLKEADRAPTIYVFGNAGRRLIPLRETGPRTQIVNDSLELLLAHDVTDGPLP